MSRPIITRLRRLLGRPITLISAAAVTFSSHRNGGNVINRTSIAATQTITLPATVGRGSTFRIETGVTATGNKIVKAAGSDVMEGIAVVTGTTEHSFGTAPNTNTITFSGTTTGGILGSLITLQDVAVGKWLVNVAAVGSGTAATPFSNT